AIPASRDETNNNDLISNTDWNERAGVMYFRLAGLCGLLLVTNENEIIDHMAKPLATLFEFGNRTFAGRAIVIRAGSVLIAGRSTHDAHHVLGIGYPIRGHVHTAAWFKFATHLFHEFQLDETALVM